MLGQELDSRAVLAVNVGINELQVELGCARMRPWSRFNMAKDELVSGEAVPAQR